MTEVILVNLGVLWVVVLANLLLTAALVRRVRDGSSAAQAPTGGSLDPFGPEAGAIAPDFDASTTNGQRVRLSDYRGKPLMLLLISAQCAPCRQAVPAMLNLADAMKRKSTAFVVACVGSLDDTRESFPTLFEHLDGGRLLVGVDIETLRAYHLPTPGYCAIDEQGRVLAAGVAAGGVPRWPQLEEVLSR